MCIPGNKTVLQVCTFSLIQVFGIAKKKERKKEKFKPFKFVERNVRCLSVPPPMYLLTRLDLLTY